MTQACTPANGAPMTELALIRNFS
ncbi:MAG: hypothetical protein RIS85_1666, partial [Pseudomonadota bacterium]